MAALLSSDVIEIKDLKNIQTEKNLVELLKKYKDKSLVVSILAKRSYEYFSTIKSFVNIPLILSSTTLAILNSANFSGDQMKIPNIVINSITGLTLAMVSNFKINEKTTVFQNVATKMTKLNHRIEESLTTNIEELTSDKVSSFIKEYEAIIDQVMDFNYPNSIKKKVHQQCAKKGYTLPNALIGYGDIEFAELNANNLRGDSLV
tara:strand:+ start:1679 stop:2293 length:615 start_codon:yes stop_codon:yes gene_type:complete